MPDLRCLTPLGHPLARGHFLSVRCCVRDQRVLCHHTFGQVGGGVARRTSSPPLPPPLPTPAHPPVVVERSTLYPFSAKPASTKGWGQGDKEVGGGGRALRRLLTTPRPFALPSGELPQGAEGEVVQAPCCAYLPTTRWGGGRKS
jgi:hypothetical protein